MADVFLGSATGPAGVSKLVVIKRLREEHNDDPTVRAMFLDEARLAARLSHPNIVNTFEVDEVGDDYIIVMEYLEGQPFRSLLKALHRSERSCPPALACHLMIEVLTGLHYVHDVADYDGTPLGVVHRDVSPQNLFLTYDGRVKVLDFGIAKGALNATDTQDGVFKGKFAYMAPEQASRGTVDRRADIFAAGVVLWELLTGRRLFRPDSPAALPQLATTPIAAPSSLAREVPEGLDAIVLKALQRAPGDRFESALEMSNALADLLDRLRAVVRHQDVARLMHELFSEERDAMTKRIQFYMSMRVHDGGVSLEAPQPSSPALEPRPSETSPSRLRGRRRPPWLFWAIGLTLALGAAAFFWARIHRQASAAGEANRPALASQQRADVEQFHLTLSSDPPEAQVEWSGKIVGQTPLLIDLTAGPQRFVVSRDGHYNASVVVNVTVGMAGHAESRMVVLTPRLPERGLEPLAVPAPARPARSAAASRAERDAAPDSAVVEIADEEPPVVSPSPIPSGALADPAEQVGAPQNPAASAPIRVSGPITPPSAAPGILPFGPAMTRPILLSGGELVVPREARLAHVAGTIIARCTITAEGLLRSCRIIKGLPFLDQPMLDSLATRRYLPVLAQGKPVAVQYVFNVRVDTPS